MYFGVLFLCIFAVIVLNLAFNFAWTTALYILIGFASVLLPSLFAAITIRILPKKWFNPDRKIYNVGDKERQFLLKIGIKKWKDKIPEMGQTVNFKKDKLQDANNPEYIQKFLVETCYAESLHISCAVLAVIFAFVSLLFMPNIYFWTVSLPVACVYTIYNIPSILIQRYNRPRLKVQLKHLTKNNNSDNIAKV